MSDLLSSVDSRTKLAGQNRLELLLFDLGGKQQYGINVFKVREIVEPIPLTSIPNANSVVKGIANMRGITFAVYDLKAAIGYPKLDLKDDGYIIITEFNQSVQGFFVARVNKIVNLDWEQMQTLPAGTGKENYLTAITNIDDEIVEIIDVEKIIQEVTPTEDNISEEKKKAFLEKAQGKLDQKKVLICDDSRIARKQLEKTLKSLGLEVIVRNDGRSAWEYLKSLTEGNKKLPDELVMLISDIEMPEMDGYKLTTEIRANSNMEHLYIVLHSSLSGVFNDALVEKVGANRFIAKFEPDCITREVTMMLEALYPETKK